MNALQFATMQLGAARAEYHEAVDVCADIVTKARLHVRVSYWQEQVDTLSQPQKGELNAETLTLIAFNLGRDLTIEAIKVHRAATGAGLRESKDYCEALRDRLKREAIRAS